jgi:hypothetical protein
MSCYILRKPEMPWGDYGDILLSGMWSDWGRKDGMLQVERTGPFVPPISLGLGTIIVTEEFKRTLETSGLTGFTFLPATSARIVHLEWEKWDLTANDPPEYPESGEPEDFILGRPHSAEIAEQIGQLWELHVDPHDEEDGLDWFRGNTVLYIYVSVRAKTWLQAEVPQWVAFLEVPRTH